MKNKCEYKIVNEGSGYALYRKLFTGEEKWYTEEVHRLKCYGNKLWLRLDLDRNKEVLEETIKELKK